LKKGIEITTIDLGSGSGAFDLSESTTHILNLAFKFKLKRVCKNFVIKVLKIKLFCQKNCCENCFTNQLRSEFVKTDFDALFVKSN